MKSQFKRLIPAPLKTALRNRIRRELNLQLPLLQFALQSGLHISIASDCDWVIYNEIFVEGMYDEAIKTAIASGLKTHVLDIGANVGFFTLRFIDLARRSGDKEYHATLVEGSPQVTKELRSRLKDVPGVEILHGLVGKRSGSSIITENDYHGKNSIFGDEGVKVDFIDLDQVGSLGTEIDLLKCDIEGAELLFIENYSDLLKRVKLAVFELHHRICDTDRCFALLRASGFTHHKVVWQSQGAQPDFSVYQFSKDNLDKPS
jgi:FkbM family methyltransferase